MNFARALSFLTIVLSSSFSLPEVRAQVLQTWTGGNGSWNDPAKWTGGTVPNSTMADVRVDNLPGTNSAVNLGITGLTLGRLRIDAGDTVQTVPGIVSITISSSSFAGAGELLLNGTFAIPNAVFLDGTKTINGSGKLMLGTSATVLPEITGVTVNNATIEGAANFGRYNNGSYPGTIQNTGTVNANLTGGALTFNAAGGSTNTGMIKATNGGTLDFNQGDLVHTGFGQILADGANSVARFGGFTVTGGNVSGTNGGEVRLATGAVLNDTTLAGTIKGAGSSTFGGTVTNNGTLTLNDGSSVYIATGTNAVTLAGTGEIVLNATQDNLPELIDQGNQQWTFQGVTVRGRGNVGYPSSNGLIDSVSILNRGIFQADRNGQMLLLDVASFDNQSNGMLRAIDGGILRLAFNGPLRNTGGTIEALNGGRVEAAFARIEGGLIRNLGGSIPLGNMTLVNPGSGMRLEGDLTLGLSGSAQEAFIIGDIENNGTLRISASTHYARLRIGDSPSRSATLSGGGEIILGDVVNGSTESAIMELSQNSQTFTLNNTNHTIRGFGRMGDPNYDRWLVLNNTGTIAADVDGKALQLELSSVINAGGTFRATNLGQMRIWSRFGFNNTGGTMEALNTSPFGFIGATAINGGVLRNVGAAANATNFDLANATLINLTTQGPLIVRDAGQTTLVGAIQNEGTIRVRNANDSVRTRISIGSNSNPSASLSGPGEFILGDATPGGASASIEGPYTNPTLTVNQTLRGFGLLGFNPSTDRGMYLINNALINADVNGKQLVLVPHTIVNNPGKEMKGSNGGTLYFHPVQFTNTGATIRATSGGSVTFDTQTILSGGLVDTQSTGSMRFLNNFDARAGVIFTNAGTAVFGEGGSTRTFQGLANGGSSFRNTGTIRKVGGGDYSVFSPLTSGTIGVPNSGAIDVQGGILRWKADGTLANSTMSAATGSDLVFQNAPFTFSGTNTFSGLGRHWFTNNTVTLADGATVLNVTGNFNFGSDGTSVLTGPGTMNVSGGLTIHPGPTTFSGVQLVTAAGSNSSIDKSNWLLQFSNGATWKNSGTISMGGYINVVSGAPGTLFKNLPGGTFRATGAQENRFEMPYENSGEFFMDTGSLSILSNGFFQNGSAKVNQGLSLLAVNSVTVTFDGTGNTATGNGFFATNTANFNFTDGAKLTGENIGLYGGSNVTGSVTGVGTLEITKALQVGKEISNYGVGPFNITLANTLLRIAPAATASIGINDSASGTINLNNGAVIENAGRINHYGSSSIASAGSGMLRTLENSNTHFYRVGLNGGSYPEMTCSAPIDVAGRVWAESGKLLTFAGGGLFNELAKFLPNDPTSEINFTGADKIYRSRGQAVEMNGTGAVRFLGTTLQFEPSTFPDHGTGITAGAAVVFRGNNTIKSVNGAHGTLSSTQLIFGDGSQVVDNATLKTQLAAGSSTWNAIGQKLELKNGAQFVNQGRFIIQAKMGSLLTPGVTTEPSSTSLFHNTSTGRLVQDTDNETRLDVDFLNDGFLEFRAGSFQFMRKFSGRGGIAVSNNARLFLSLRGVPLEQQPQRFELNNSAGISVDMEAGQTLAASIFSNGGQLVAAGGLNLVAAGGLNMVAAGGGNIVAAGGMNMVAAGGGNLTARGAGSFINANSLISQDSSTLIGMDGGSLIARLSALISSGSFASMTGARLEAAQALQVNNAAAIARQAAELRASSILSHNGGVMVAAGGGNMVAAGGGNMVAAGGGNLLAKPESIPGRIAAVMAAAEEITAAQGRDQRQANAEVMARYRDALATTDSGMIAVEAGGTATAQNGGSIIADMGGILTGAGTFNGPGLIKNGGMMAPGSSPGTLTWTGNLTFQSGSLLDLEIGGTTAGRQYDVVNVSGAFTMNGALRVRMLNGFGSSVQASDVFDVVVAGSPITTGLAGTRVAASGSYGSFAVQLVNGGNTLRLTDFQAVAPTFNSWASRYNLTGANAGALADPNGNGNPNVLDYALGLDPTVGGPTGITTGTVEENGQKYLTLSYTKPTGAEAPTDILYQPERASSLALGDWSASAVDLISLGAVPGPGSLETVTVRSTHPLGQNTREFLRLRVTLQ